MEKQPLVILTGPTAVGKTSLSISLAKAIGAEIISADSMQVYKGMDIGTAKIRQEMQGVKHYLIDVMSPDEEFDITVFKKMACEAIDKIRANGHIPLIVGGTGFIYSQFFMISNLIMPIKIHHTGMSFTGLQNRMGLCIFTIC